MTTQKSALLAVAVLLGTVGAARALTPQQQAIVSRYNTEMQAIQRMQQGVSDATGRIEHHLRRQQQEEMDNDEDSDTDN